jgi:ApaG protein
LLVIPGTGNDGQSWIAGKAIVGLRPLAENEDAAAVADDVAAMAARGAESGANVLPGIAAIVHDGVMFTSEATTRGVRVSVVSEYAPDRSQPSRNQWFFLYTITITNEGAETVQLLSRHWIITDATGQVEEVKGPGVIGQQPVLEPGESFTYTSGCPLRTSFGVMEGTYQMVSPAADEFDVKIAPFTLSGPHTVH